MLGLARMRCRLIPAVFLFTTPVVFLSEAATPPSATIVTPTGFTAAGTHGTSTLYTVEGTNYKTAPPVLLDLHGSRFEQGEAYGALLGAAAKFNYHALVSLLLKTTTVIGIAEQSAVEALLDWQWSKFLSKQVPEVYLTEFDGFASGCKSALGPVHDSWCTHAMGRLQVLANMPGDIKDFEYVLLDEAATDPAAYHEGAAAVEALLAEGSAGLTTVMDLVRALNPAKAQCSMVGVWGSRTDGGELFSGRNLDWNQNSGIDAHKLITVFHPPEAGRHAHATLGFAGLYGSLAGMSAAGLTTHEANLESKKESFRGLPWLIRLRLIMETSADLAGALAAWDATNNTVGFNHMVGSAADKAAVVLETHAGFSARFDANDPKENASAIVDPKDGTVKRGATLPEAVWRTNHGFAPETVANFMWNGTIAYNDSDARYHLIHDALTAYEAAGTTISAQQIVDITSLVGQKGPDYTVCAAPYTGGSNVLSVGFAPAAQTLFAAWEDGANATWTPAACSPYVTLNFSGWF